MSSVNDIIINGVTISTTRVDEAITKRLIVITPPSSSANFGSGAKDTIIVDLLRIERRLTVRGFVLDSQVSATRALITTGGTLTISWDGDANLKGVIEKLQISKDTMEDDNRPIQLTLVIGEDFSTGDS